VVVVFSKSVVSCTAAETRPPPLSSFLLFVVAPHNAVVRVVVEVAGLLDELRLAATRCENEDETEDETATDDLDKDVGVVDIGWKAPTTIEVEVEIEIEEEERQRRNSEEDDGKCTDEEIRERHSMMLMVNTAVVV